jgi:hypothetical protein
MLKHQRLHRVGAIAPSHQDHQLQHLAPDHVTKRQDHDREHAAIRRSHTGRKHTSTPVTEFPNGTGHPEVRSPTDGPIDGLDEGA